MKIQIIIILGLLSISGKIWAQSCPNPPVLSINASSVEVCAGDTVILNATGANNYSWNNGISNGIGFVPITTGVYTVIGFDGPNCSDTASILITVLPLPEISIEVDKTIVCEGDSVLLNASNGVNYQWINPINHLNNSWFVPAVIGSNTYIVIGTGTNGCKKTSQVIVLVKELPESPSLNNSETETCLNIPFANEIIANGGGKRVFWFNDLSLDSVKEENSTLTLPFNFVYQKTYYARTFSAGCFSSPISVLTVVYELPEVSAGEDIIIESGAFGNLNGQVSNGTNLLWSPTSNLINPMDEKTGFQAFNSIVYTITGTDENGCVNQDEMILQVEKKLNISDMLTPNGDGLNDTWKIFPEQSLQGCLVRIFDGFGREMINTKAYQNDWNGTFNNQNLPDGDYYYQVKCEGFEKKGTLILIR